LVLGTASRDRASASGTPHLYVLILMASTTVMNVMDRQLMAVLIDPIKRDLGVSDAAMGLLTGTSFVILHVGASIPIAIWADRGVRRSIIALGLGLWSGLTMLTGFARGFTEMFVIRVGVGIGEASGGGPAQSLLADTFPPERRATALAVLVMGGPLGSMVAFAGGGWLGEIYGWRAAFVIFGAPGLLLALLIRFTLKEPTRGAFDLAERRDSSDASGGEPPRMSVASALRFLVSVPALRWLTLASGLNSIGLYAILIWAVPYMTRVHEMGTGEAGTRLAIASGLFTALGTFACGPVADRLASSDVRWLGWLPSITSAAVVPFAWGFALAPDSTWASLLVAPASFLAGTYFGPVFSGVQTLAAPQMRALAAACVTICNTILGLGVAPPLVGWLNDVWASAYGAEAIRYSLALVLSVHLIAAIVLALAARTLAADLSAKDRFLEARR
jgi:predicted MFS family arabinose efflux permease